MIWLSRAILLTVVTVCLPFGLIRALGTSLEDEIRSWPALYRDAWNGGVS